MVSPESTQKLSARELDVVRLVVDGLTNDEIAERLSVSPRTVQTHVARIADKLGVRTRTQVAVAALRLELVPLHPPDGDQPSERM